MKRLNYLVNGLAALALIVLFSQCTGKADNQTATTSGQASGELTGMKIAYVEIDTLLAQYNFCVDLNEGMVKKSENVRMTINQKARELDKQKQEFQTSIRIMRIFLRKELSRNTIVLLNWNKTCRL